MATSCLALTTQSIANGLCKLRTLQTLWSVVNRLIWIQNTFDTNSFDAGYLLTNAAAGAPFTDLERRAAANALPASRTSSAGLILTDLAFIACLWGSSSAFTVLPRPWISMLRVCAQYRASTVLLPRQTCSHQCPHTIHMR